MNEPHSMRNVERETVGYERSVGVPVQSQTAMTSRGEKGRGMRFQSRCKLALALPLLTALFLLSPTFAQAALQYVGGASATGTGATYNVSLTGLTGGIGSAAQAGDLVIVVTGWASTVDGNPGITTPTGYTEVYDLFRTDTRAANLSVNWKIMGGSPDTSVTVSGFNNAANGGATVVHVWRGADQTTPMDVAPPTGAAAGNAARPDSPAITPVTTGAYVLTVGLGTGPSGAAAFTAPVGYGNGISANGSGTGMSAIANIASIAWTSGAVDPAAWTGGATSTSDSWVAGTLAIRPALLVDTLSVTSNTALAASAAPLATGVQMQMLQVDCNNTGDSNCSIASITVDDLGTAGATDISNLHIYIDTDSTFAGAAGPITQAGFNGSSTVVSLLSWTTERVVTNAQSKYIWIVYDLAASADTKSLQSRVTAIAVDSPDNGATGTWDSNLINVTSGPPSTIAGCDGCHGNPPTDEATRNPATGGFVGDHQSHFSATTAIPGVSCSTCHTSQVGFNHRNANIELATPIFGGSGSYSRTASFPQSNNPTTGTCSNINCHYNTPTPQWGRATPIACNECHALPPTPASDAHNKHYTAKAAQGWTTGTTTQCLVCHPDNTVHSNVTDNSVNVEASLGFNGSTCSSTPTGCHNGKITPPWSSTGITCSNCHVIGGGAAGDPTSGLHNTTNLTDHDDAFGTGGTCLSCHTTAPSSGHFNATVDNSTTVTYTWNTTNIPAGYNRGTDSCAAAGTCHSDGGTWNREWIGVADEVLAYTDDASTDLVCGNCHGSFATGWNIIGATDHGNPDVTNDANAATADNPDTLATSKASHGECTKCHGWGHTNYSTGTKHKNNLLEMNSTLDTTPGDGDCTTNCHSGQALTMTAASGWTDATVVGAGVACGDCHNGGVTPTTASGAHDAHGATFASVAANPASIALCVRCHGNDGTGASHNNGTLNWATNLTYSAARGVLNGTCSGTAGCHVSNATNAMWDSSNLTNCNQCHQNTADVNNWGWNGTAAGNISMISSTEYTAVGHGQATINTAAANKACMDCHDLTQPHDTTATLTGSNPFRLKAAFTCNSIVAGCHTVTGLLGTHDQATAGSKYTWPFAAKCVDCHDPHGDGSNLSMIHSDLADKGSAANWVRNTPDAAIETMVFTNTTGILADSYAEPSATFDGICQECHTLTTSMKDNLAANGANHTATTGCMGCHGHDVGFKASGCNGCHGGDNATIGNKNFWPGAASGSVYPDRPGEHNIHIQRLATKLGYPFDDTLTDQQQKTMCAYCHPYTTDPGEGGHYEGASGTAPADVTAAAFNPLWSALTGNYPSTADAGTAAGYSGGNGTGGSCSGIDCHNDKTTPTTQEWYDAAATSCVMCHTVGGTNTVDVAHPASGIHDAARITGKLHDDSFTYNNGANTGDCITCHTATPTTASGHMNGTNDYSIGAADAVDPKVNLDAAVGFTDAAVPTCSPTQANGCHIEQWAAVTDHTWTHDWHESAGNNDGTECRGCHGTFTQTWNSGVTPNHTTDYDGTDGPEIRLNHDHGAGTETEYNQCISCHVYNDALYTGGLGWNPTAANKHGNGQLEMIQDMGYNTTSNGCGTTCHTSGEAGHYMTPDSGWTIANLDGPNLACTGCHAGITTHIDADGAGTTYPTASSPCEDCHTSHSGYRSGTNAANDVYISTIYGRTVVAGNPDTGTLIPTMNNQYASHDSYIQLGGVATNDTASYSTEAEMCWGCHDNIGAKKRGPVTTIAFPTATTITDSGNGFITAGFSVGDYINVAGSSQAANNNKPFRVTAVAAGTLTIGAGGITTDTSAGESVTITAPISEWGGTVHVATGSIDYDQGLLFSDASTVPGTRTSNWTTGVWRSGKGLNSTLTTSPFWYKRGSIRSLHSANYDGTTAASDAAKTWKASLTNTVAAGYSTTYNKNENRETVGNIRCTYCHDVHGTHNGTNGDVASSPDNPYLRGTWRSNPYPEDGAPRYNMSIFTDQNISVATTAYGAVPRGSADPNNTGLSGVAKVGGYWIDQNSGNPTSSITGATALDKASNSSGLCEQCHGANKTGTWTAAAIGTLDQVTGEGLWVSGGNGHANSVIGAAGVTTTAANIFNRTRRGSADITGADFGNDASFNGSVDMGLATKTGYGVSYRQSTSESTGLRWKPWVANATEAGTTASRSYAYRAFAWNNTSYQTSTRNFNIAAGTSILYVTNEPEATSETAHNSQANYHTFTCSKCHNPHASRLPKLMITNCLDTNHNTWEDKNTFTQAQGTMISPWSGLRHSQWPSAQNCHRLDSQATTAGTTTVGTGWNTVTPWKEDASPNPASGSGKTVDISTYNNSY